MPDEEFVNEILRGAPESWDGDGSAESIALDYVREIERRLYALGGTLEKVATVGASSVTDRRTEAREAFMVHPSEAIGPALDAALAVATRAHLTERVEDAYTQAVYAPHDQVPASIHAGLSAALRELGFEVVE